MNLLKHTVKFDKGFDTPREILLDMEIAQIQHEKNLAKISEDLNNLKTDIAVLRKYGVI